MDCRICNFDDLRWISKFGGFSGVFLFFVEENLRACNLVSSVSCILCTLSSVSRLPISLSGSLESCSGILDCLFLRPITPNLTGRRIWGDLRITPKSHRISSQCPGQQMSWKLAPRPPKIMENVETWGIQDLRKWIFAILPVPNACFSIPRHLYSDPKITRKSKL